MADHIQEVLLRLKSVTEMTGLAKSSIYALEKRGLFPARVSLSPRCVAWKLSAVQAFIESCKPKLES